MAKPLLLNRFIVSKDAEAVCPLIKTKTYDEPFSPAAGVKVNFKDAGHILGAAVLELFIEENGTTTKLVFSGDIGRRHQLLMKDPSYNKRGGFSFYGINLWRPQSQR